MDLKSVAVRLSDYRSESAWGLLEYITATSYIRITTQTFANGGIGERFELENAENREGHFKESEAAVLQQVVAKFGSMKTPDLIEKATRNKPGKPIWAISIGLVIKERRGVNDNTEFKFNANLKSVQLTFQIADLKS